MSDRLRGKPSCDHTLRSHDGPCHGWVNDGWPWHACHLDPGHGNKATQNHECPCGFKWAARRRLDS